MSVSSIVFNEQYGDIATWHKSANYSSRRNVNESSARNVIADSGKVPVKENRTRYQQLPPPFYREAPAFIEPEGFDGGF